MHHQRDSDLIFIVRAVVPLPGPESLALLACCGSRPAGTMGFRDFPSWPSATPPGPQTRSPQSRRARPAPASHSSTALPVPVSHLPQLMGPVAHGGRSAPSPDLSPEGLKVLSLEVLHLSLTLNTPFLTLRTPTPPRASKGPAPFTIHSRREEPDHRTPKVLQVGIPFSSPHPAPAVAAPPLGG